MKEMYAAGLSLMITTTSLDTGDQWAQWFYDDKTLSWLLKLYVTEDQYRWDEPHPKYFRVVHKGKSLFLSSAGKNTLFELGFDSDDEIKAGRVQSEDNNTQLHSSPKKITKRGKKAKNKGGAKKKRAKPVTPPPSPTEEQLREQYRQEHSKA